MKYSRTTNLHFIPAVEFEISELCHGTGKQSTAIFSHSW